MHTSKKSKAWLNMARFNVEQLLGISTVIDVAQQSLPAPWPLFILVMFIFVVVALQLFEAFVVKCLHSRRPDNCFWYCDRLAQTAGCDF